MERRRLNRGAGGRQGPLQSERGGSRQRPLNIEGDGGRQRLADRFESGGRAVNRSRRSGQGEAISRGGRQGHTSHNRLSRDGSVRSLRTAFDTATEGILKERGQRMTAQNEHHRHRVEYLVPEPDP